MRAVNYLGVTGAMRSETAMMRRFILPDRRNVARSLRFGAHAFSLNGTMQILPVGDYERLRLGGKASEGPARKIMKTIFSGFNVRSLLM